MKINQKSQEDNFHQEVLKSFSQGALKHLFNHCFFYPLSFPPIHFNFDLELRLDFNLPAKSP